MFTDDELKKIAYQINKITYQIVMNYNATHSKTAGNVHPGKLFDAVRKALKEFDEGKERQED